jgi:hypothetical protein
MRDANPNKILIAILVGMQKAAYREICRNVPYMRSVVKIVLSLTVDSSGLLPFSSRRMYYILHLRGQFNLGTGEAYR